MEATAGFALALGVRLPSERSRAQAGRTNRDTEALDGRLPLLRFSTLIWPHRLGTYWAARHRRRAGRGKGLLEAVEVGHLSAVWAARRGRHEQPGQYALLVEGVAAGVQLARLHICISRGLGARGLGGCGVGGGARAGRDPSRKRWRLAGVSLTRARAHPPPRLDGPHADGALGAKLEEDGRRGCPPRIGAHRGDGGLAARCDGRRDGGAIECVRERVGATQPHAHALEGAHARHEQRA